VHTLLLGQRFRLLPQQRDKPSRIFFSGKKLGVHQAAESRF
jgi:hypothetical protein